ncbi:MAG TPA: metallophosphoesterase, partial [Cyclobacteriaceae bacterium]|nr:metallophosphoesterase [Cyclobacteriaceae bacterium]
MSKTFVIGDIHGSYRALLQCLELSSFNYHYDQLICLGDISDGWPETREAIDEMLKIRNLTFLLGNHDFWTLEWMETGYADSTWLAQGGAATVRSYGSDIPRAHHELLKTARPFHILND